MAAIPTPSQAKTVDDLSLAQFDLVRQSLGINDNPLRIYTTYIIFDAVSGNNNLHLDTGVSSTYEILKGNGTVIAQFTDTGGVKVLNYTDTGRYLIAITGVFYGINTDGASQADKDKYIGIIAGTNYPSSIPVSAFKDCSELTYADMLEVTTVGAGAFENCTKLECAAIFNLSTMGNSAFSSCSVLREISYPVLLGAPSSSFKSCEKLNAVYLPLSTSCGDSAFEGCQNLTFLNFPLVTNVGDLTFKDCSNLIQADLPIVTSLGASSFSNCSKLKAIKTGIVTVVGATAFSSVILTDLFVIGGNESQAVAVQAAIVAASGSFHTSARLMYDSGLTETGVYRALGVGILASIPANTKLGVKAANTGTAINVISSASANPIFKTYESGGDGCLEVLTGGGSVVSKLSGFTGSDSYVLSNFGIGVAVAGAKLDVKANGTGGTTPAIILRDSGDILRSVVTENGSIGINTTPSAANVKLEIKADSNSTAHCVELRNDGNQVKFFITEDGWVSSLGTYAQTTTNAANLNIQASTGNFLRSTSSEKYKKDIDKIWDEYSSKIYEVAEKATIFFKSKCEGDNPEHTFYGISAEKLAEIEPRLVFWGYSDEDYDLIDVFGDIKKTIKGKNGKAKVIKEKGVIERKRVLKKDAKLKPEGVQYDRFVPLILNEMKVLKDENEALKLRLEKIEKHLEL